MKPVIFVVIPCYKAKGKVGKVVKSILIVSDQIESLCEIRIVVVNDACPIDSWEEIECHPKINFIHHKINSGVGAATLTGFHFALDNGCIAVIKVDADGQHSAIYLKDIIKYLIDLPATELLLIKGSRYLFQIGSDSIPWARRVGSLFLEPIARGALAYRGLTDISNGYIAMNRLTCRLLLGTKFGPKLNKRYLFESSLLVRSNYFDLLIYEVAMNARYGENWNSSMETKSMLFPLLSFWLKALISRFINKYINRLNLGSLLLLISSLCCSTSIYLFFTSIIPQVQSGIFVSAGTSTLFTTSSAIAILTMLLFFLYDYNSGKQVKTLISPSFLDELNL